MRDFQSIGGEADVEDRMRHALGVDSRTTVPPAATAAFLMLLIPRPVLVAVLL